MRNNCNRYTLIGVIFISYFIFLLTSGIGSLKYGDNGNLNFIESKFNEIESKYYYLLENMSFGDIEENNREILYLEEMKEEILESLKNEKEFWLIDLKNLINQKKELLLKRESNKMYDYGDINYLKLKNEIDEYTAYYNLKQKPIEYADSFLIKYFMSTFNSKIHQVFLTFVILGSCFCLMRSKEYEYSGFLKTSLIIVFSIFAFQILNLIFWGVLDRKVDLFYPVRVIKDFDLDGIILDAIVPFYKIMINTFLFEMIYILFVICFMKIIDLIFEMRYLKIFLSLIFVLMMIVLEFTKFSFISMMSYGRFFDITRGFEFVYKWDKLFNVSVIYVHLFIVGSLFLFIHFYKRYILNDKYI